MNEPFPTRKGLKMQGKRTMMQHFKTCCTLSVAFVVVKLLLEVFLERTGGIPLYYWDTSTYSIQSGMSLGRSGLFAALRMEEMGIGLSVAVTPSDLGIFFLLQMCCATVIAPLRMGCLSHFWAVRRGEPLPLRGLLTWYTDLFRGLHAIALELILCVIRMVLQMICLLPALLLLWYSNGSVNGMLGSIYLAGVGLGICWCLLTQLDPARILFAQVEDGGAISALKGTWRLLHGRRFSYLVFRLSFIVWELLAQISYGIIGLYLFPYRSLSELYWVEAAQAA